MSWKKIKKHWKKISFGGLLVSALLSSAFSGCREALWKILNSTPKAFALEPSRCVVAEPLDERIGKKLWDCDVDIKNPTNDERKLNVECKTERGNFYGSPKVVNQGGSVISSPLCFDGQNLESKKCALTLKKDEFIKATFQVAAYEEPRVICTSDSF